MPGWNLNRVAELSEQATFNPGLWPIVLHELSREVGALGAALLTQEQRLVDVPVSADVVGLHTDYIDNNWVDHDERYAALPVLLQKGVVCDQDISTPENVAARPYYQDFLARHNCRWFAGLGHALQNGPWIISIQRTIRQGPFEPDDMRRLSTLRRAFGNAAALSHRLSLQRCAGLTDAIHIMGQPAIVLDRYGRVLALNALAERWMGDGVDLAHRSLSFRDVDSQASFEALVSRAMDNRLGEGPVVDNTVVRDRDGLPIRVRAFTLRDWTRSTFTGARALVVFDRAPTHVLLQSDFGLTRAEVKLALLLASGHSVMEAAAFLDITYHTARSQLRSVFLKTDTNRQGQLIAYIRGMSELPKTDRSSALSAAAPR